MKSRRTDNGSARGMSVCEANVHAAEALKRARGTLSPTTFTADFIGGFKTIHYIIFRKLSRGMNK